MKITKRQKEKLNLLFELKTNKVRLTHLGRWILIEEIYDLSRQRYTIRRQNGDRINLPGVGKKEVLKYLERV